MAFGNADLSHTQMGSAFLDGADLSGADLTGAELNGVQASEATRWPEGFDTSKFWRPRSRGRNN